MKFLGTLSILAKAQELLKGKEKVDESKIAAILRDHSKDNKPSLIKICRHIWTPAPYVL
jgi:hypothetical protein